MKKRIGGLKSSLKCEICKDNIAFFTCVKCERQVCHNDYSKNRKICKICEMSLCEICNENLSIGSCENCGRLICENCTAAFDGARRICKKCIEIINRKSFNQII